MAFAVENFAAIAQNKITKGIASNFYPRLPFLTALGAFTLTKNKKNTLSIGRPGAGEILSGRQIDLAEVESLPNINAVQPRIQRFETNNSKWMAARDVNPTVAAATTNSHGQAGQAAALFMRWNLKTPIMVWHRDLERCQRSGSEKMQGLAAAQLIAEATEVGFQDHVKALNTGIWTGNPTSQSADPNDAPIGILQAFQAANTYGNIARATEPTWQAKVDSTITSVDIKKIVDDALVIKGLRDLGASPELLIVTTKALYLQFKSQITANAPIFRVLSEGIPGMAAIGVKQECLQYDNCYVIYDANCPANTVLVNPMETWNFMIFPGKNLTVSKFTDLSIYGEGAKNANQAFVETEAIFYNSNPALLVKYDAIGL